RMFRAGLVVSVCILTTSCQRPEDPRQQDASRTIRRKEDADAAARRRALVIGNKNYARNPLSNPLNDADDMNAALRELGFEVQLEKNTLLKEMQRAVREFTESLRAGDGAFFYYSGHGRQVKAVNDLLPVDFQATTASK